MSGYYIIPIPNDYLNLSGGTVSGNTNFSANLSANTVYLNNTPSVNNTSNYVLVYNISNKEVEYRDASSIGVLGNFLPISGGTLTGPLFVPEISGTSISGATFYSGSTPLENIFPYSGINIGFGTSQIFAQKNNNLLEFRTLSAGTNIDIDQTLDTVIISFTGSTSSIANVEDGLNTYTSSTISGGVSINVSGLTVDNLISSGNTNIWNLSAYTLSANTIYSGSTPIQNIFPYSGINIGSGLAEVFAQKNNDLLEFRTLSAGTNIDIDQLNDTIVFSFTGNTIPSIENGINTFTANTLGGGISINVTGLTIDNLVSTGNTNIWNLTANTLSANTIYSGSTPIQSIFPYSGTNIGSGIVGIFAQKNNDLLEFKTLSAGTRVKITGTSDTVIISTSGINSYYIQALAPSGTTNSPLYDGDRWFNTLHGLEFVYIDDGDSSQWVEIFAATPQYENYGTYVVNTNNFNLTYDYFYYGIIYDGAVNLYLPSCTGIDGKKMTIKDELGKCNQLGKRIRISGATGENIDGNNYVDMAISKMALQFISRGNNWYII